MRSLKDKCCKRAPLTVRERITLTSWQKWTLFHRFPWKLMIDGALAIVLVTQVLLLASQDSAYANYNYKAMNHYFPPEDYDAIYSVEDFYASIKLVVANYYKITNTSAARYAYVADADHSVRLPEPPVMTLKRYPIGSGFWNETSDTYQKPRTRAKTETIKLTPENPLGAFNESIDLAEQLYHVVDMRITMYLESLDVGLLGPVPYIWKVEAIYTFTHGAGVITTYTNTRKVFADVDAFPYVAFFVMASLVICLSLTSGWLSFRSLRRSFKLHKVVRRRFRSIPEEVVATYAPRYSRWEEMPLRVKAEFYSLWSVFNIVANAIILAAEFLGLWNHVSHDSVKGSFQVLLGIAVLMGCFNVTRFLEYNENLYTLILTLRWAGGRVVIMLVSVFPLFLGYALAGVSLFSQYSDRFATFDKSCVTLFALLNGDEIHASFEELAINYPYLWISRVYMYSFTLLFITAILNVFIFIIEESYDLAKTWSKKKHLKRQAFTLKNVLEIVEEETETFLDAQMDEDTESDEVDDMGLPLFGRLDQQRKPLLRKAKKVQGGSAPDLLLPSINPTRTAVEAEMEADAEETRGGKGRRKSAFSYSDEEEDDEEEGEGREDDDDDDDDDSGLEFYSPSSRRKHKTEGPEDEDEEEEDEPEVFFEGSVGVQFSSGDASSAAMLNWDSVVISDEKIAAVMKAAQLKLEAKFRRLLKKSYEKLQLQLLQSLVKRKGKWERKQAGLRSSQHLQKLRESSLLNLDEAANATQDD